MRVSFILKFYFWKGVEKCCEENLNFPRKETLESFPTKAFCKLVEIQNWYENARDILDDSDEILSVKYQLVYSIGNKSLVSGGDLRWKIACTVLNRAQFHLKNMC